MSKEKQVTKSSQDQAKVNQASTSTITEELISVNMSYFSPRNNNNNQNTDKLTLKLNRLKDQSSRYVSQKEFLTYSIVNKLTPKGLDLSFEPTIGNYDQQSVNKWYSNLKNIF